MKEGLLDYFQSFPFPNIPLLAFGREGRYNVSLNSWDWRKSEDTIRPNSEAILNLEFLDLELYSVIEHILDCLPGEGLNLSYEQGERSKVIICDWKIRL